MLKELLQKIYELWKKLSGEEIKLADGENAIHYICGSEALPLPFNSEEEYEMLKKLDEEKDVERIRAGLIEHNLRLVVYIARKFDNTGVDAEDLVSIGTLGLIKAINSYR
ncbi:MAG: RNA polymerase sporulation sigma factor SigE, partial [Clostridia bacterium]|nr:RNA polymerase sporulation sigma factor SigE [Clostridia bacterium]